MDNKFNTVENLILNFLQSDTDVSALVKKFHQKILPDPAKYGHHELPALAVHAYAYANEGEPFVTVQALVEVVGRGGDLNAVDDQIKNICSLVIDKLNNQSTRDGYTVPLGSDEVDDVMVTSATIDPQNITNGFLVLGHIQVAVTINER